jgi:predicted membrane protein
MSIHHFLHLSTLNDSEKLSFVFLFLLSFSLNELLISLIDLILMILSHQSLNNLDVATILLRTKAAYACNLARSSQSFFHSSVRSFFVRSLFLCSFVFARFLFAHSSSVVSLSLFVRRRVQD